MALLLKTMYNFKIIRYYLLMKNYTDINSLIFKERELYINLYSLICD